MRKNDLQLDKLLTLEEAAQYLDIHPGTLYRWVKEKRVPSFKVGRIWRFKKEKLEDWLKKNENMHEKKYEV
ncbi:MAG: helix-turn-helix domain-containing protein [Candidatus Omnitrophica bacterium]|nr:helix-turn-helix domain-containing protein [Candidatus Omnitrophota bacterium]